MASGRSTVFHLLIGRLQMVEIAGVVGRVLSVVVVDVGEDQMSASGLIRGRDLVRWPKSATRHQRYRVGSSAPVTRSRCAGRAGHDHVAVEPAEFPQMRKGRTRPCESGVTSSAWEAKCRSAFTSTPPAATCDSRRSAIRSNPRPEGSPGSGRAGDERPLGQLRAEGRGKDESTLLVERVLEVAHESGHRRSPSRCVNRLRPGASVTLGLGISHGLLVAPGIPLSSISLHILPSLHLASLSSTKYRPERLFVPERRAQPRFPATRRLAPRPPSPPALELSPVRESAQQARRRRGSPRQRRRGRHRSLMAEKTIDGVGG